MIIKMLMILDFKILSLWFVIEYWSYNTLTRENNWFLNVLSKSNFATPTPFGSVFCFVVGICLSNYNLKSFPIHQASYSKGLCIGKFWEASEKLADTLSKCQMSFLIKRLAITSMYCNGLHAWWSTQSGLATLLSCLIARRWVGLQTLWRFQLKDLSIDEMIGAWYFGCCQAHQGLPVGFLLLRYSCYSVLCTVESLSFYILIYMF